MAVVAAGFGNNKQAERWQFRQIEHEVDRDELFLHRVELFTKRNLTFPGDALKAFAGAAAALFPFHFGLPKHLFTAAMNWTFRLRSRMGARNNAFPSWSWAGWTFGETGVVGGEWFMPRSAVHYPGSSPDYVIKWYEVDFTGQLHLVNDDSFALSRYDEHDAPLLADHRNPVYESPPLHPLEANSTVLRLPNLKHILHFWSIGAYLAVSRQPEPREHPLWKQLSLAEPIDSYRIHAPDAEHKLLGQVALDRAWRAQQPNLLYFFVVSRSSGTMGGKSAALNAMLVEFDDAGIAYRVQAAVLSAGGHPSNGSSTETHSMWLDARPAWKLISLA
ncbi:hypothetical protein LTR85_001090 [Meristemomyces frigidus]|nr:hypothetical protein LTR85_001090 [Meristemomyces frigidus]